MSELSPLVSISCITYNHAPFIRQCLDGLLIQKTDFPIEIVLYDDASTDETVQIVKEYASKFPGIFKPFFNSENQYSKGIRGINMKFNFHRCEGKYIAFCEGDDFWTDSFKLQKQIDFLEKNKEFSMSCTNYSEVNVKGEVICETAWTGIKTAAVIPQQVILEKHIPKILTSVFRKEAFKVGMPDEFYQVFNTDNFLCAIAANYGPAGFLNFNSGSYRVHNQGIWSGKSVIKKYEMQLDTFQKMKGVFKNKDQQKAIDNRIYAIRRELSRYYLLNKELIKSTYEIRQLSKVSKFGTVKAILGNLLSLVK